jgi:hypothetical protein
VKSACRFVGPPIMPSPVPCHSQRRCCFVMVLGRICDRRECWRSAASSILGSLASSFRPPAPTQPATCPPPQCQRG